MLASEKEVNRQVQAALEQKRKKLATIQSEAEIAVSHFKTEMAQQMQTQIAQVSYQTSKQRANRIVCRKKPSSMLNRRTRALTALIWEYLRENSNPIERPW